MVFQSGHEYGHAFGQWCTGGFSQSAENLGASLAVLFLI